MLHAEINMNIQRTTLPNGIHISTAAMPHARSAAVEFLFKAGSRYEPEGEAGIAHLFEHLLFKGTKTREHARDVVSPIVEKGGIINAFTARESAAYWCKISADQILIGIETLADMVKFPLLREEDIIREKEVVFEEIRAAHDSPSEFAGTKLDLCLWPDQPLGRDIAGSIESVRGLTLQQMMKCLESQYTAENLVVAVAGGIQHNQIVDIVERLLGDLRSSSSGNAVPIPFKDSLTGPQFCFEKRPLEQCHLAIGMHGLSYFDDLRYALTLLSVILGETMTSRLFEEVREKRGLAYDIHTSVSSFRDAGAFYVECGTEPSDLAETVEVIVEQLALMKNKGVSDAELTNAKECTAGRLILSMEDSRAAAGFIGSQELHRNEILTLEETIAKIQETTTSEIAEAAETVINSQKAAISVVGPSPRPEQLEKTLNF